MSSSPLPDWFPDPSGAPQQRYWDGWINHKPHAPAPHRTGLWIALSIVALLVLFLGGCTALIAANPHTPMVVQLSPSSNTTMKLPFDVPTGTLPTTIELHDSVFSDGVRVQVS